jgi:nitric oxide reductase NorD protein
VAEAEDLIVDAARHATIYARRLWSQYRGPDSGPQPVSLPELAERLDLLIAAAFGRSFPLRPAQPPAPPTVLVRLFRRHEGPPRRQAIPGTDGSSIWLPPVLPIIDRREASERYRAMAMQQAMRAVRGSAQGAPWQSPALLRDCYLLIEAWSADHALLRMLPGMRGALLALRGQSLGDRPGQGAFPLRLRPLEDLVRGLLGSEEVNDRSDGRTGIALLTAGTIDGFRPPICESPAESLAAAHELAARLAGRDDWRHFGSHPLLTDCWTGELRKPLPPASGSGDGTAGGLDADEDDPTSLRSARLARRPEVRESSGDDDDDGDQQPGPWMVQPEQPHETAEDPFGMQRPTDRDVETGAEEFADAMSELPEARLVSAPGKPKEVLLSDDPPDRIAKRESEVLAISETALAYPEWDWRIGAYREPGAIVRLLEPALGLQQWVDDTIAEHRSMLDAIGRQFEMLRAQRLRLRRQLEGEEIDLEAFIDSYSDFRAGLPLAQDVYRTQRRARRDMSMMLLIDVSGSTDGWVSSNRRIIDVEREALLLVCLALDRMAQPYSIQAFSGKGPSAVTMRALKRFDEHYGEQIARRIAALEPEHYTRAGAAIRHATSLLMREPTHHRLLLLLSDGKPNDVDDYEGRYGVEDMRQAVAEARLQGVSAFCLTIDRQAAGYLPAVFGPRAYALLPRPELLPAALLDWIKRLVAG